MKAETNFWFIVLILYYLILIALIAVVLVIGWALYMVFTSWKQSGDEGSVDWSKYLVVTEKGKDFEREFANKKIPMETFIEAYFAEKVNVKGDLYDLLKNHRNEIFRFSITQQNAKDFFMKVLLPGLFTHTKGTDFDAVSTTYNIGNDFYASFLGETMLYSCALFDKEDESLEDAQNRKLELIANKIQVKAGDKHLDIGCGWGGLAIHCAKKGTKTEGISLSQEQVNWGHASIKKLGDEIKGTCKLEVRDYRDLPANVKYNKISCVEMAEHVGIKNYQAFIKQLYSLLDDQGHLYFQIAGLRPSWTYEDLVWGLFMGKYIFPGADASCPINWVTNQLERAGFEVHSVENVGFHYSLTIKKWYENFLRNKDESHEGQPSVRSKYGERLCRIWLVFLAWSSLIAGQGTSTAYQIVAHKNTNSYNRSTWVGHRP